MGPEGVVLSSGHKALQQFLVQQHDAGVIICVCSKNVERDVSAVFERRDDMVLRASHVTSWRVNWEQKSVNIQSIAAELDLGLDSFVVLDDDAFVCAEIEEGCLGGIGASGSLRRQALMHFVRHLWAPDRFRVTEEDRRRSARFIVRMRDESSFVARSRSPSSSKGSSCA